MGVDLLLAAAWFAAPVPPISSHCLSPAVVAPVAAGQFQDRFGGGTAEFEKLARNVAEGFRVACAKGLIDSGSLLGVPRRSAKQLAIQNLPDGNVAMFEADQVADGSWRLLLSYPFVGSDGSVNVPTAAEVTEAIHCAVRGASEQEQEESGRCLAD